MKRAALFVGLAGLVLGVALALWPFRQSFDMHAQGLTPPLIGVSGCGVPLAASFADEPDGGWFTYAPDSEVSFSGRFECRSEARWRAASGLVIGASGVALVVFAAIRGRSAAHRSACSRGERLACGALLAVVGLLLAMSSVILALQYNADRQLDRCAEGREPPHECPPGAAVKPG